MANTRENLITQIYDNVQFPDSQVSVYNELYYAMADALNMESQSFNEFFPYWIDPMTQGYKLNEEKCTKLNLHILRNCNLQILNNIADYITTTSEHNDYDDGYDSY